MMKFNAKKWIFSGILGAAVVVSPFISIPFLVRAHGDGKLYFEGNTFPNKTELKKYIDNKYGHLKTFTATDYFYYDLGSNAQSQISSKQLQEINSNILRNTTQLSILNNYNNIEYLYDNRDTGQIDPAWFLNNVIRNNVPIAIYHGDGDVIYYDKSEALDSFVSATEVYYFDNIYFRTTEDLKVYLNQVYFKNPENQNKVNEMVVVIGPNGVKSRQITLDENGNWQAAASSFVSENYQSIIKFPNDNNYLNGSNEQFIGDYLKLNSSSNFENYINYYQIKHNNTSQLSSSSSTWVAGTNLADSYDFTGTSFYQGDNENFNFDFINIANWEKNNDANANIDSVIIDTNNQFLDSFLSKYFNIGSIDVGGNRAVSDYQYLIGAENNNQKLIGVYNNATTNDAYHNYISSNIALNPTAKQRINLTESVFDTHQAITNTFIDEMNKTLYAYFNTEANQAYKNVYESAITVANTYHTDKKHNILFRLPLLYYYMMNELMQKQADNELLDVVRFYFKSIAAIMTNVLEMKLGESALLSIDNKKLDLVEVFGLDEKIIDFDLNKLETYFVDNYPALCISAAMVESTSLAIQNGVFPTSSQIENQVELMIGLLQPNISSGTTAYNNLKRNVIASIQYQLQQANHLLSNPTILAKAQSSYEAFAAFVMVEIENQKVSVARNQILDLIIQEAGELINNPDSWEYVPNDNRFKIFAYFLQVTANLFVKPSEILANINPSAIETVMVWNNVFTQLQIDLIADPTYSSSGANSLADTIAKKSAFDIEDATPNELITDYDSHLNANYSNNYNNLYLKNDNFGAINDVVLDGIYLDLPAFVALTVMRMLGDLAQENTLFVMNNEFNVLAINDQYKTAATRIVKDVWQNQPLLLNQLAILHKGFQIIEESIQQNKQNLHTADNGAYGLDYATAKLIMQNVAQYASIMNQHLSYFKSKLQEINVPTKTGQIIAFSGTNTAFFNNLPSVNYAVNVPVENNIFSSESLISDDVLTFLPKLPAGDTYVIPYIEVEDNVIKRAMIPTDVYTIPKSMINDFPMINEYEFSWQKFLDVNQLDELFITPTNDMINDNLMCYFDKNISYYNGDVDDRAIYLDKWNGNANLNLSDKKYVQAPAANVELPTENVGDLSSSNNDIEKPLYVDVIGGDKFKTVWSEFVWSATDKQFVYVSNSDNESIRWVIDLNYDGYYKIIGYPINETPINYYYEYMVINNHVVKCKKYNSGVYQNDQILAIDFNDITYTLYDGINANGEPIKNEDTTILQSLYNAMNSINSQNKYFQNEMLIERKSQTLQLQPVNAASMDYNSLKTTIVNKSSPYFEQATNDSQFNSISQATKDKLSNANTLLQQAYNTLKNSNNNGLSSTHISSINTYVNQNKQKNYDNCFGLLKIDDDNNITLNDQTILLSQSRLHQRITSPKTRYIIGILKFTKSNAFKKYVATETPFSETFANLYAIWSKILLTQQVTDKFIDWNLNGINKSYYPTYNQAKNYLSRYDISNNPDNLSSVELEQIKQANQAYYDYVVQGLTAENNFYTETDSLLAFIAENGHLPSPDDEPNLGTDNLDDFIDRQAEITLDLNEVISTAINEQFYANNMFDVLNEWSELFISYAEVVKLDNNSNNTWVVGQNTHDELLSSSSPNQNILSEYDDVDLWIKSNTCTYNLNQPINQKNSLNVTFANNYFINRVSDNNNWINLTGGKYLKLLKSLITFNSNMLLQIIDYRNANQSETNRGRLAMINLWAVKSQDILNELANVWGYFTSWISLNEQTVNWIPRSDFYHTIYKIKQLHNDNNFNFESSGSALSINRTVNDIEILNEEINQFLTQLSSAYTTFSEKFNIFDNNKKLLEALPAIYQNSYQINDNNYAIMISDIFSQSLLNLSQSTSGIDDVNSVVQTKNVNIAARLIEPFVWDNYILAIMQFCFKQLLINNNLNPGQQLVSYQYELDQNNIWTWSGGYTDWSDYSGISDVLPISDIKYNPVLRISNEYINNSYYYNGKFYYNDQSDKNNLINEYAKNVINKKAYNVDYLYSFSSMPDEVTDNLESITAYNNLNDLVDHVIDDIEQYRQSSVYIDASLKSYSDGYNGDWTDIDNKDVLEAKVNEITEKIRPTIILAKPVLNSDGFMIEKRNESVLPGDSFVNGVLTTELEKRRTYSDFSTDNWFIIDNSANDLNSSGTDFEVESSIQAVNDAENRIQELAVTLYEPAVASTLTYEQTQVDLNILKYSEVVDNIMNGYQPINVLVYEGKHGQNYFVDTTDPQTGEIITTAIENLIRFAYEEEGIYLQIVNDEKYVYVYDGITFQKWEELYEYAKSK